MGAEMDTRSAQLGGLLFSPARGGILRLLLGQPGERFFIRQISREIGVTHGPVQRELETLLKAGLLLRSQSGHQVYYQADRSHPVFVELQTLIVKTVVAIQKTEDVYQLLRSALATLAGRVSLAFVYKSTTSPSLDEEDEADRIDLMIVGEVDLNEIRPRFATVEAMSGRSINAAVISASSFRSSLQSGSGFLTSILRGERVFLIGTEEESLAGS
jgi:hypothetical protein